MDHGLRKFIDLIIDLFIPTHEWVTGKSLALCVDSLLFGLEHLRDVHR